jgi:hypothetical protein
MLLDSPYSSLLAMGGRVTGLITGEKKLTGLSLLRHSSSFLEVTPLKRLLTVVL